MLVGLAATPWHVGLDLLAGASTVHDQGNKRPQTPFDDLTTVEEFGGSSDGMAAGSGDSESAACGDSQSEESGQGSVTSESGDSQSAACGDSRWSALFYKTFRLWSKADELIQRNDDVSPEPNIVDEVVDTTPLGRIFLGARLATGWSSRIYAAELRNRIFQISEEGPRKRARTAQSFFITQPVAVKYSNDCGIDTHPLEHEFLVLSILNTTGIAPHVFYLSGAAEIPADERVREQVRTRNIDTFLKQTGCVGAQIRFLVEERVGSTFSKLFEGIRAQAGGSASDLLLTALELTAQAVLRLEALHAHGLVHGDIHEHNIAVRDDGDVVLIDFEYAKFYPLEWGTPKADAVGFDEMNSMYLSVWQLEGDRMAPRDDVYRLLESLSRILHGAEWTQNFDILAVPKLGETETEVVRDLKWTADLFVDGPFGSSVGAGLPAALRTEIQERLEALALEFTSAHPHPDDAIDYDSIIDELNELADLL